MRFHFGIIGRVALIGLLLLLLSGNRVFGYGRPQSARPSSEVTPRTVSGRNAEYRFRLPWSGLPISGRLPRIRNHRSQRAWKGRVGPTKAPGFFWAHRVLVVSLRYERGKVRALSRHVVQLKRPKRYRRLDGRFLLRGSHHGKRLFEVAFDFPLLGATASYTRRDRAILSKMARGLVSRVRVVVPWDRDADRLVLVDRMGGRSMVIKFPRKPRPAMCRVSGSHDAGNHGGK
ncbi:MAG: hypothetical protein J7M25_14880 [Deltaproteobacteria bacterium]|nr:hypothetical protein [Deltaproteobacteria bacterium]